MLPLPLVVSLGTSVSNMPTASRASSDVVVSSAFSQTQFIAVVSVPVFQARLAAPRLPFATHHPSISSLQAPTGFWGVRALLPWGFFCLFFGSFCQDGVNRSYQHLSPDWRHVAFAECAHCAAQDAEAPKLLGHLPAFAARVRHRLYNQIHPYSHEAHLGM